MVIKRICSWCGCSLPPKECESFTSEFIKDPVSHTICAACFEKLLLDEISSAPAGNNNPNEKPKGT